MNSRLYIYGTLVFIQFLFGLNFIASKLVLNYLSAMEWGFVRFLGAAILMTLTSLIFFRKKLELSFDYLLKCFFYAFLGISFVQVTMLEGLSRTSATNASILTSTIPLFTILITAIKGHEKLKVKTIVGFVISFLGVLAVRNFEEFSFSNAGFIGDIFVLVGALSLASFFSFSKGFLEKHNGWWTNSFMFLFAALQVLPFILIKQSSFEIEYSSTTISAMLFSIIGGTLFAYVLGNWALKKVESSTVSLFVYLQPVFAILFAIVLLDEPLSIRSFISVFLILTGFFIALEKGKKGDSN